MDELDTDDTVCCPVCFNDFQSIGDFVPRLLPCTHTLCHQCVQGIRTGRTLVCPLDRKTHPVSNGDSNFPENKYILKNLTKPARPEQRFGLCQLHDRHQSLFCQTRGCEKPICQICHIENHKAHDVVDPLWGLQKKQREVSESAEKSIKEFTKYQQTLKDTKQTFDQAFRSGLHKLRDAKQKIINAFEQNERKLEIESESTEQLLDKKQEEVQNAIETLETVKKRAKKCASEDEITELQDAVEKERSVAFRAFEDVADVKTSVYSATWGFDHFLRMCSDATLLDRHSSTLATLGPVTTVRKPDDYSCLNAEGIQMTSDGTLLVLYHFGRRLVEYIDQTPPKVLQTADLDECITKMVTFSAGGQAYVALLYERKHKRSRSHHILFRRVSDLSTGDVTHTSYNPIILCAHADGQLLYVEKLTYLHSLPSVRFSKKVYALRFQPSRARESHLLTTLPKEHDVISGMRHVVTGGVRLLVVVGEGMSAYNTDSGELEWVAKVIAEKPFAPHSVTSDGRGHLFVSDTANRCIQVFSTEGTHLGPILSEDKWDLGSPTSLDWADSIPALVVQTDKHEVKVIKFPR